MTNTQFYVGIAIPCLLIILAWLHQNQRLTDFRGEVHRGFDQTNARLDRVDAHLGRIDDDLRNFHGTDKELEGRLNELSARIK